MGFGAAAKAGKRVLFPTEIYPLAVFLSGALLGGTMFGFKKLNEVTTSAASPIKQPKKYYDPQDYNTPINRNPLAFMKKAEHSESG
eukprot:m.277887 g.277887  ORF g.277887 m.277887 type:complete len:86 (-) comp19791_c0_seq12:197-454(-)